LLEQNCFCRTEIEFSFSLKCLFSKFKIFKTIYLLRMILKVKLESSCRWRNFVFGDDQIFVRNQEKKMEQVGPSVMNSVARGAATAALIAASHARTRSYFCGHLEQMLAFGDSSALPFLGLSHSPSLSRSLALPLFSLSPYLPFSMAKQPSSLLRRSLLHRLVTIAPLQPCYRLTSCPFP